ncbi:intraflagellar transport protein 22 homolog isoform X2 [Centruroides vittatus]|uniref:intraflagellar transport protein 22 homolog isoform X2 n=1 Tax=Centruroides vittatus TaxID=120091 RepID=UPI00351038B4
MFKTKILVVGPSASGKSVVCNFLAEATDSSTGEYHPTQGVRILEFESDTINVSGRIVKAEVELWDCSGDTKYANFVQAQNLKDNQCIVFCHQIPGNTKGSFSQLSSLFSHVHWIQTNVEDDGNVVRQEFNNFLERLLSNINERRDQEELSIMNHH